MAGAPDPYRALGLARAATETDIKKAHRKLAKKFHPDAAKGDAKRFLVVQEAYRVLSDPLLRREWDARHAPGPIRASAAASKAPTKRPQPAATRPARPAKRPEAATTSEGPAGARPRSTRSYTWSASEVPWWEEGLHHKSAKRPSRRRSAPGAAGSAGAASESEPAEERPVGDFEVYNRSSGAAWSMAARAYFRKGDADLPSRGVFRHNGAQPLTAGKSRAAAEAEARRQATSERRGDEARGSDSRQRPER
jgi:curved DNA-binding protein CbpA